MEIPIIIGGGIVLYIIIRVLAKRLPDPFSIDDRISRGPK
jgi:hypothetical protein